MSPRRSLHQSRVNELALKSQDSGRLQVSFFGIQRQYDVGEGLFIGRCYYSSWTKRSFKLSRVGCSSVRVSVPHCSFILRTNHLKLERIVPGQISLEPTAAGSGTIADGGARYHNVNNKKPMTFWAAEIGSGRLQVGEDQFLTSGKQTNAEVREVSKALQWTRTHTGRTSRRLWYDYSAELC